MKAALFITSTIPREDGVGIEQRTFRNLKLLQKSYDTTVVLIKNTSAPLLDRGDLPEDVVIINLNLNFSIPNILNKIPGGNFLWFLSADIRYKWCVFKARESIRQALMPLSHQSFFLVFFFRLSSIWLHAVLKKMAITYRYSLMDFDDIESIARLREFVADKQRIGLQKYWASLLNIQVTKAKEAKALRIFDIVTVCSDLDKDKLEQKKHNAHVATLPNTIRDIQQLPYNTVNDHFEILIVGLLSYGPNIDSIVYFYNNILPILKAQMDLPVNLTIVGRDPGPEVYQLAADKSVTIAENVPSVLPYYQKCHILVAPLRAGGGTRLKILEAMSYGRPVVTTSIGAEGLGATDLKHLLIADQPELFSAACIKLCKEKELYENITKNARHFVETHYGINSVSIEKLLPPPAPQIE